MVPKYEFAGLKFRKMKGKKIQSKPDLILFVH